MTGTRSFAHAPASERTEIPTPDRDDQTAQDNEQNDECERALDGQNPTKEKGVKVHDRPQAKHAEDSTNVDVFAGTEEGCSQTDEHNECARLTVTQAGLPGNTLHQNHERVGTDTQCDEQLTAAFGDAYAQKQHEKTANHKRKA